MIPDSHPDFEYYDVVSEIRDYIWEPYDHLAILHRRHNCSSNPLAVIDIQKTLRSDADVVAENEFRRQDFERKHHAWQMRGCSGRRPKENYLDTDKITKVFEAQAKDGKPVGYQVPAMRYLKDPTLDVRVDGLFGVPDVYMSQNSFSKWRKEDNWTSLGAFYLDFDSPGRIGLTADDLAAEVLRYCDQINLPRPSYLMSTGVGLASVWLHSYVHKPKDSDGAYPRWKAVEMHLHKIFKESGFGSLLDANVKDAARILRLAGTVNSKSGKTVHPVYINGPDQYSPKEYPFGRICSSVFSTTLEAHFIAERRALEEADLAARKARKDALRGEQPINKPAFDVVTNFNRKPASWSDRTPTTYVRDRNAGSNVVRLTKAPSNKNRFQMPVSQMIIDDLERLRVGRGGIAVGFRDTWLFITSVNAAHIERPEDMPEAIKSYGSSVGFDETTSMRTMGAVLQRAQAAAKGETITFNGIQVDPRYRFKVATIIELLQITEDEMREFGLKILLTEQLKLERRRIQKAISRNQITVPRSKHAIMEATHEKRKLIMKLLDNSLSTRKVAAEVGCSQSLVRKVSKNTDILLAA